LRTDRGHSICDSAIATPSELFNHDECDFSLIARSHFFKGTLMKTLILLLPLAALFAASPAIAALALFGSGQATTEHSGGCRKDSPAGKCCHAGSKPYHCH
jgi:hypothetical protein